jgi:hypothetical protein
MILTMALLLAAASVYVELKLVKSVPGLKKLVERFGLVGLAMSLALSVFLGGIFGAAGVTIMIAGMCSTAVTAPIYRLRHQIEHKNAVMKARVQATQAFMKETKDTYRPVGKVVKWTAIGVTSPIWAPVIIRRKLRSKSA